MLFLEPATADYVGRIFRRGPSD
ncbi:uncharacterized protein METZ01_LOCUS163573, partial [marine metagenome]